MKNSKIESLERKPNSDFQSKYKENQTVYAFHIKFENGDEGQINAHSETPSYKVGDSIDYTIKETQFGFHVKKENSNYFNNSSNNNSSFNQSSSDRDARICRQNALTNAVSYYNTCSGITNEVATPKEIIDLAEEFSNWTCNGEKKENPF